MAGIGQMQQLGPDQTQPGLISNQGGGMVTDTQGGSAMQAAPQPQQGAPGNPLQPSYLPTPPTALATTYNPATAGSTGYNAATYQNPYDPAQATSELQSAAGVQDQQQNQNLMSMLAAQGISPGSSAAQAAAQNLGASQTAALAPALAGVQQYAAGLGEQSGLANAGAQNTAGQFGAGASNTASLANQGAYDTAGQYNAGANNAMTSQNLQDLLQSQEFNAGAYNSAGSQSAGFENQDWLAQLQAQLGLQQQGLSNSGSLAGYQANQQVPMNPSLFSQVTGAASAAAPFSQGSFGGGGGGEQPTAGPNYG